LCGIEVLHHAFGKDIDRESAAIERLFGIVSLFGGGLEQLPAWVRGLLRADVGVSQAADKRYEDTINKN
jgi:hypothetical protein